jgi:hypothetical protein
MHGWPKESLSTSNAGLMTVDRDGQDREVLKFLHFEYVQLVVPLAVPHLLHFCCNVIY